MGTQVLERREMYLEPVAQSCLEAPAISETRADQSPILEKTSATAPRDGMEITVLTYNVKGLPWPIALGRGRALKEIGRELAELRREGRQPDVVLLQEGFRGEIADLVRESGYRYWAKGPAKSDAAPGEGQGAVPGAGARKFTGSGLHILSDAPIVDVRMVAYASCAGLDCMANKGAMLARLAPAGVPMPIEIVNTHMNSRHASRAPAEAALEAHNAQTRELIDFIGAASASDEPMLVGGDFNVKNAPARYYYGALERPYTVVSEFCARAGSGCGDGAADAAGEPWLRAQDLQAFRSGAVRVQPVSVQRLFDGEGRTRRLSDHDGYLVRYRLSWSQATLAATRPAPGVEVKPQFGRWGFKVSWKR